jgi:hypothetical protein
MITDIKAVVEQVSPSVSGEGNMRYPSATKLGQLFTADWRQKLLLAGKLWRLTVGAFAADAEPTQVTGGGAGTTLEIEKPEMLIGVDAGYYLLMVSLQVSLQSLADAASDDIQLLAISDRSQAPPTSLTGTVETPDNLLDGAGAFPGRAYSAVTADITDPVMSEILYFQQEMAAGTAVDHVRFNAVYEPAVPSILAGPCQIAVCWGGTIATAGMGSMVVGCVPTSWFPVS